MNNQSSRNFGCVCFGIKSKISAQSARVPSAKRLPLPHGFGGSNLAKPKSVRPISGKPLDAAADFNEPVKKQADLPGMENRAIEELESAARRYAAIRDKRMALNEAEVKLKDLLLGLLKKHDKREYQRDGIRIWIKVEEETVKVKVDEEGGEHESVRNETDPGRANREDESSAGSSEGTPGQAEGQNGEVGSEAGAAGEGEDSPF